MRIRKDRSAYEDQTGIDYELIALVSDALAHPVRLRLCRHIMQMNREMKDVCTKDMVEEFDYAQATISQHMKKLVRSGLVEIRKEEKFAYYYANLGVLARYIDAIKHFSVL